MRNQTTCALVVMATLFAPGVARAADSLLDTVKPDEVLIHRDRWGIPHIYGRSAPAVAFGCGYAQAEDHLDDMLRLFLSAKGELSRVDGESALQEDFTHRTLLLGEIVDENWDRVAPSSKDFYRAFAGGINRYIETHPEVRRPWYWTLTARDVAIYVKYTIVYNGLRVVLAEVRAGGLSNLEDETGSNAWAISGSRSASGHAMLHSNPHLPWRGPRRFGYETHLKCPEFDMAGAGFFGIPVPIVGHNGQVAWTATNNGADIADAYAEKTDPKDPDRYLDSDGQWKEMERRTFEIEVAEPDGSSRRVSRTARYTRRGPYMTEPDGRSFSLAIAGWRDFPDPLTSYLKRAAVRDLDGFRRSLAEFPWDKWNLIYADRAGNIFTVDNGLFPRRDLKYDWNEPVPGWKADAQWKGFIPFAELPQFANPPNGLIVQCNNPIYSSAQPPPLDPKAFPPYLARPWTRNPPDSRAGRAFALFDPLPKISWDDNRRAALDVRALSAGPVVKALLAGLEGQSDPDLTEVQSILNDWDFMADLDNRAVPILLHWLRVARKEKLDLKHPDPERLLASLKEAAAEMRKLYGSVSVAQREVHLVERGGEYPAAGEGSSLFLCATTAYRDGKWYVSQGSSWLMLLEFDTPMKVFTIAPLGASEDPKSPHHADQTKLFSKRELKPFPFEDGAVRGLTETSYRLKL